jgi:hypothetical protein
MNPYDGDRDEQIQTFKQEHIPQPKKGLVRNGIRKKRDVAVSLRCVRRRRNHVTLESRVASGIISSMIRS